MSMSDTLNKIERHTAFMLNEPYASPDEFRQSFQRSNIIHDLRWLSPGMEFASILCGMEALHVMESWSESTANAARVHLEAVELFLEGCRIGYRDAQKEQVTA